MSMWEIESLIEDSINLVDKTDTTNGEKIKLIGSLYAIQKQFDCSFTNFRVMPVLLQTGYTKTIDYTEHPDYEDNKSYFEELIKKDDIIFIYRDIKKKWSSKNRMVAYWDNETRKIYVDHGSPLRKDKRLKVMNVYDLGIYLIREANRFENKGLVYEWTAFLLNMGPAWVKGKMTAEEIIDKYFEEIKAIWSGYNYSDYEPLRGSLTIYTNPADDVDDLNEFIISMGGVKGKLLQWFLGH